MGDLELAEHVAGRTADRMRVEWMKDLELFAQELRTAWREDLRQLRDDLTARGLLTETGSVAKTAVPIHVLVVDDYPEMRRVFVAMLKHAGMVVAEADSGVSGAQELASNANIEVVIADISMPKNGHTLCQHVREKYPHIEVILTSGYDLTSEQLRASGAFGFLPKPFNLTQAVLIVERAAEARRMKMLALLAQSDAKKEAPGGPP